MEKRLIDSKQHEHVCYLVQGFNHCILLGCVNQYPLKDYGNEVRIWSLGVYSFSYQFSLSQNQQTLSC